MKPFFFFLLLTSSLSVFAQQGRMVVDLTSGSGSTFGNNDDVEDALQVAFKNKVLFLKRNTDDDKELWVSDGTANGTNKIFGTTESYWEWENSDPELLFFVYKKNDKFVFSTMDKNTLDTTIVLQSDDYIGQLTMFKDACYFRYQNDLWKYDPLELTTELVYDFSSSIGLRSFGVYKDLLIIIGRTSDGTQLLKSDGTTDGTLPYHLLNDGNEFFGDSYMVEVGDLALFFYYTPSDEKYYLYVTDGTTAGTKKIKAFKKPSFKNLNDERQIISWNDKLFFAGLKEEGPSNAYELFVSDGTVSGTFLIDTDGAPNSSGKPQFFTPYKGLLYFVGDEYSNGNLKLYKTDGTQAGTSLAIGEEMGGGGYDGIEIFRDSLCLDGYKEYGDDKDLIFTDGTESGTRLIDILPKPDYLSTSILATDKYLFLIGTTVEYGRELWVYDPDSIIISNENIEVLPLLIYPNPCVEKIWISANSNFTPADQVNIYSADGRLVYNRPFSTEIELKNLKTGFYKVVIRTNSGIYENSFLKK